MPGVTKQAATDLTGHNSQPVPAPATPPPRQDGREAEPGGGAHSATGVTRSGHHTDRTADLAMAVATTATTHLASVMS